MAQQWEYLELFVEPFDHAGIQDSFGNLYGKVAQIKGVSPYEYWQTSQEALNMLGDRG